MIFFKKSKSGTVLFHLCPVFCLLTSGWISVPLKSLRFLILNKIRTGACLLSFSITLQKRIYRCGREGIGAWALPVISTLQLIISTAQL